MRINIFAIFTLIAVYGGVSFAAGSQKTASEQIFGNMTYFVGYKDPKPVTLHNGRYCRRFVWDVNYHQQYVYGDFNHDGLKDAAVIIWVNPGGGNIDEGVLTFLINDGTKLIHRASQYLEDHAIINSVKEKNGKVVVDMYVHQEGDCHAGPSKRVRRVYEYPGPQFPKGQA